MILTTKGLLRLDELGDVNGEEWQTVNDVQVYISNGTTRKVSKFYVNGKVQTRKITTLDGLELESSFEHRYRVLTKDKNYIWKTVEELKVGDMLVVKCGDHPENIITPLKVVPNLTINQPE